MNKSIKPLKPFPSTEEELSKKDMMRQVTEAARLEAIQEFITKHKKSIIYVIIAIISGILASAFYYIQIQEKNKEYSKLIHEAMVLENSGQNKAAVTILEKINNSSGAPNQIKVLSLLRYGSKMVDAGDIKKAVEAYLKANNLSGTDEYMHDLSGLLAVKTMIDSGDKSFNEQLKAVFPKIEKNSSILQAEISEQKAIFEWSTGNFSEAQKLFEKLSVNDKASEAIKSRSWQFSEAIKNSGKN